MPMKKQLSENENRNLPARVGRAIPRIGAGSLRCVFVSSSAERRSKEVARGVAFSGCPSHCRPSHLGSQRTGQSSH